MSMSDADISLMNTSPEKKDTAKIASKHSIEVLESAIACLKNDLTFPMSQRAWDDKRIAKEIKNLEDAIETIKAAFFLYHRK